MVAQGADRKAQGEKKKFTLNSLTEAKKTH
jgi:hypothetical protein